MHNKLKYITQKTRKKCMVRKISTLKYIPNDFNKTSVSSAFSTILNF